jgi:predicted dehydrogenase
MSFNLASRRHFLRTSTALGLAASTSSALDKIDAPPLKLGLIGCGGRGTGAASQALAADDGVILHAVGDAFASSIAGSLKNLQTGAPGRAEVPIERQFSGLDAYQKVLESGVDVVVLATPPGFRPQHLKAAVDAGKHVFCEKPMAVDAVGVRSVMESATKAKAQKTALVAGYCWRYSDSRREAFAKLKEGAIGEITGIFATYYTGPVKPHPGDTGRPAGMGDVEWQINNWYNYSWLSGDSLVEQAIHSVDKIGWALGDADPIACVATGGRQVPAKGGNIYDHFHIAYEFPNNVWAHLGSNQQTNCHRENSDYIRGTKGSLTLGKGDPIIEGENPWRYRNRNEPNMYQTEHDELFASIRAGNPINDGDWMSHSTLLGVLGRMAAYTGKRITWKEAMESAEDLAPDSLNFGDAFDPGQTPIPGV